MAFLSVRVGAGGLVKSDKIVRRPEDVGMWGEQFKLETKAVGASCVRKSTSASLHYSACGSDCYKIIP
ncbi:MAG: hypothetical protein AB8B56_01845 [Crocinitomicaceae bacterium]